MSTPILRMRDENGVIYDIPAITGDSAYAIAIRNGFVGTEKEWLDSLKPAGLPTVTSSNNGQFLRVVNGVWTAVDIPTAEGASF